MQTNLVITDHWAPGPETITFETDDSQTVDTSSCDVLDSNVGVWAEEGSQLELDGTHFAAMGGHGHIHICAGQHSFRNVDIDRFGVPGKLGSYPIHFHQAGDTSRGSIIEDTQIRNFGNHAVVLHGSHGITCRNVTADKGQGHAFWCDPMVDDASNDTLLEGCTVRNLTAPPSAVTAFRHWRGRGNACIDCVAEYVGWNGKRVTAGPESSGYSWITGTGVWVHQRNTARACRNGIFVWQNDNQLHVVEDFTADQCETGIQHGAYQNSYHYKRVTITDCRPMGPMVDRGVGIRLRAVSHKRGLVFDDVLIDGADIGVWDGDHQIGPPLKPVVFNRLTTRNIRDVSVYVGWNEDRHQPQWLQFNDCDFDPNVEAFRFKPDLPEGTRVEVNGQTIYPKAA